MKPKTFLYSWIAKVKQIAFMKQWQRANHEIKIERFKFSLQINVRESRAHISCLNINKKFWTEIIFEMIVVMHRIVKP